MRSLFLISSLFLIRLILITILLPSPAAAWGGFFSVQIDAVTTLDAARQRVSQLRDSDIPAYFVISEIPGRGRFFRIRVGKFASRAEARRFGEDLVRRGAATTFFVAEWEPPVGATPEPGKPPAPETTKPAITPALPVVTTTAVTYRRFEDAAVGYSLDIPSNWEQARLTQDKPGLVFRSVRDSAFLNVIWNRTDRNAPEIANELLVDLILRGMNTGQGRREVTETARRVTVEGGLTKIALSLAASFDLPGSQTPSQFDGRAIILRAEDGILLVAVFYHQSSGSSVAAMAEHIIGSARR